MAIRFKVYQNNNQKSDAYQKFYARPVLNGIVDTEGLAEKIQQNVSAKESDVYAVLKELKNAVKDSLLQGYAVRIDGLGIFRPSFSSKGTAKASDFTATNIKTARLLFLPESKVSRTQITRTVGEQTVTLDTRIRTIKLLEGISFVEDTPYESLKDKEKEAAQQAGGGTANP